MGVFESRQVNSAIKSDTLQNVKKAAFIQSAIQDLQSQTSTIKQNIETSAQQKLSHQLRFIQSQKDLCSQLFNAKVNQISSKDPELIDRLEAKRKTSFMEITGYKRVNEHLQKLKNKSVKQLNAERVKIIEDLDTESQKIKQKLCKQTPLTPALDNLGPQVKQRVFAQFIEDQAYEIQKDEYKRKGVAELNKAVNSVEDRFEGKNLKEEVSKFVDEFRSSLDGTELSEVGCGFGC